MAGNYDLSCKCGHVTLAVLGTHIAVVECLCNSCRAAAARLEKLEGLAPMTDALGATPFVMHRKDRIEIKTGHDQLRSFQLKEDAGTRRVIATCCNTPIYMEMKGAHWLSVYGALWPEGTRPPLEMRTMTGDSPRRADLPSDVPNLKTHNAGFYLRLLTAWARMGFRNPTFEVKGNINA